MVGKRGNGYRSRTFHKKLPSEKRQKSKIKRSLKESIPEINFYLPEIKNYYLTDLLVYKRKFKLKDIGKPEQERPVIDHLITELNNSNSILGVFKPLEDLLVTDFPEGIKYEVDFMQRLLITSKAKIIDVRFEVKVGCKNINSLRKQLTNIEGELYPIIVEQEQFYNQDKINNRFKELFKGLGDVALGFILYDGHSFHTRLNLDLIKTPKTINSILNYKGFNNIIERDLLITAYSLIKTLGYLKGGFRNFEFENGSLFGKNFSFSTQPLSGQGNHLLVYKPSIGCLQNKVFSYQSIISQSLMDDYHGQLDDDFRMDVKYVEPPTIADSVAFIDPAAQSKYVINGLIITKNYLVKTINGLNGKINIEFRLPSN